MTKMTMDSLVKNQIIYVYSTESLRYEKTIHKSTGDEHYKAWFKIGMTTQETADDRILQQDRTSNPEPLIKLYDLDLIKGGHIVNAYEIEQKIHRYYDRLGLRVRDRREWFEAGSVDEIKLVIESILNDSDLHKPEISLKPHQIEANKKINECFLSDNKRCLLNHKPRSGKTYITIYNIKENNYKNVIILTSYPILNSQWEETIKDFKGFSNINIIIGSGLSSIKLDNLKNNILLLSLQDAKGGDEDVFSKEKFDDIKDMNWDLMVIDEVHYGVETQKTKDLLDLIKHKRLLGLSATPTKNLICGTFDKDQIHTYSLIEECELKKKYPSDYPYADINFYLWNLLESERKELKYFSDEEQFTFEKFFRIEGNDFHYKSDIVYLFKKLIGSRDICGRDKLRTEYPFKNSGIFNSVKSILLFLPKIEIQAKLKELLDSIDLYNEEFDIHITNSEINSSKSLFKKIKREFKSRTEKRSLIIAVDQLTTGITLEDCDMVMFMNDWRSVDKYIQASFRCQSPRLNKENCFVVDFNAARNFEMIWEYNNILSKNNGKGLEQTLKEWIESVNIFNRVEGELKRIDFDSFNQEYNKIISEKPRFNYSSVIFNDKLKDEQIRKSLSVIGLNGGSNKSEEDLDDDVIDKGKSKKGGKKGTGGKRDLVVSDVRFMEIAKALVDKTMLLSVFTYFKHDKIDDCFDALQNDNTIVDGIGELERNMFMETLLLGMDGVDRIDLSVIRNIYDNIYDKNIIDKKLYIFNQKVKTIYNSIRENPDCYSVMQPKLVELIDSYLKPSTTEKKIHAEVMTPTFKINEALDMFDPSDWKNPNLKWFGPSAGLGNFQVVMVQRLMEGLKEWQTDSELRLKHILENQMYISELQGKNLFLFLMIFDSENKYKMNFYKGSFLDEGFDNHMKNVWKVDKFDRIAENPPFQRRLDLKFLDKCLKICNQVVFIHPSSWLIDEKDASKSFVKLKKSISKNLHKVQLFNGNKIFNIQLFIPCCISYINLESESEIKIDDRINNKMITYQDIFEINKWSNNKEYLSIKNKLENLTLDKSLSDIYNVERGQYYINMSRIRGHSDINSDKNMLKDDFYTTVTKETKVESCKSKSVFFSFDSNNDAENFLEYLKSKVARFCLSINKNGSDLNRIDFNKIPLIDFSKKWSNEEIVKEFNLTSSEVDFINKNIPNYYE